MPPGAGAAATKIAMEAAKRTATLENIFNRMERVWVAEFAEWAGGKKRS